MRQTGIQNPGLPRYLEIATELRREIATGKWSLGDKLPPIANLAKRFDVAPLTARQAVKNLEGRGIVDCRHGAGTYVAGTLLQLQSLCLRKDLLAVVDQIELGELVNLPIPADGKQPEISAGLAPADSYHRLRRLFQITGQPALISETFMDRELYLKASKAFDESPALPLAMELMGDELERASHVLTVDLADIDVAEQLNLARYAPVAKMRLVLRNQKDVAAYICTLIFPAELIRVEFDI